MKVIEPGIELWHQEDAVAHVAKSARICYGKESGNNDQRLERQDACGVLPFNPATMCVYSVDEWIHLVYDCSWYD